jgi:hypothetical protein
MIPLGVGWVADGGTLPVLAGEDARATSAAASTCVLMFDMLTA